MWYYNIGIVLSIFLAILIVSKKNKNLADWILSAWLIVIGIHIFLAYLFFSGESFKYSFLLGIESPIPLMHGPLLYLYVKSVSKYRVKLSDILLHFIPVILCYLYLIPFMIQPDNLKILVYTSGGKGYELYGLIQSISVQLSGVIYVLLSMRVLIVYRKTIRNTLSNLDKIQINWLFFLILSLACIWIAVILGNDTIVFFLAVVNAVLISFIGIDYAGVHASNADIEHIESQLEVNLNTTTVPDLIEFKDFDTESKVKYEKSSLSDEDAKMIHEQLIQLMSEKKLFVNPDLSLTVLANELDVNPNTLSQVINSLEGCSFYDYINRLRIEEFISKAKNLDNKNFTLLSIAYECGYNSKTSFNRNFKNAMKMSPSEYLETMKDH